VTGVPTGAGSGRAPFEAAPTVRALSLGAGVQSSVCLLLACRGEIAPFDVAIFADTGWEPRSVYRHLDRLERLATAAGIPIRRVGRGNIRADALDPAHRFASMPLYTLSPQGGRGMARRQCTYEYKVRPIKAEIRGLLGYPHPSRVPADVYAQMALGISLDELHRARDADVAYMRNTFPLLDLGWRREDCIAYLTDHGLGDTPRSSCVGCPYHSDEFWQRLKIDSPAEWDDAVAFDAAIRHGSARANTNGHPLRGTFWLHSSRRPLDQAPLRTAGGDRATGQGCGPWTCPATTAGETPGEVA
jgi:3'-phosphoadenosine 5'-phosphosulfate sulfotransferase (PAPS reductase)/FAD synthetase